MKKRIILCAAIFLVLLLLIYLCLKNITLSPMMYKGNGSLSAEENRTIKALVLNAVKDRNSILYHIDQKSIYSFENKENIIQLESPNNKKALFCIIDGHFMEKLAKTDDNTYKVIVEIHYPEQYFYHFTIERSSDGYKITQFLIDI